MNSTAFISLVLFSLAVVMTFGWLLSEKAHDFEIIVRRMYVGAAWAFCAILFTWFDHPPSNPMDAIVAWFALFVATPRVLLHKTHPDYLL